MYIIEQRIKDVITVQLGAKPEQLTPQARFIEDLCADSLDLAELVLSLEDEFTIELSNEEVKSLLTIGDVVQFFEKKI